MDGIVTVANDATLNFGTGDFSICFWAKKTGTGVIPIISVDGILNIDFSSTRCRLNLSGTLGTAIIQPLCNPVSFTHIAFSYDSSGVCVPFVNGNAIGTGTDVSGVGSLDTNPYDWLIGFDYSGYFSGSLDDLRIYKGIALTQEQVSTIYNNGIGKKYDEADAGAGLAFNFDEGTGNPVSTGTATLTGTITGGVTWNSGGVPFDTPNNLGELPMNDCEAIEESWGF